MTCQIVRASGGVFSVWGKPEREDIDRVVEALQLASREFGGPVVYITRVPAGAPAPEGEAKRRVSEAMSKIVACCSSYHVIFEGEGFMAAFKRGVLTSLLQPLWRKRMFFVHAHTSQVKAHLLPSEAAGGDAVLHVAQLKGLTSGPAVASPVRQASANL